MNLNFKFLCATLFVLLLSTDSFASYIVVVTYDTNKELATTVKRILKTNINLPEENIELIQQTPACKEIKSTLAQICIDAVDEMHILKLDNNRIASLLGNFINK